jgi:hypothetical protein
MGRVACVGFILCFVCFVCLFQISFRTGTVKGIEYKMVHALVVVMTSKQKHTGYA